MLTTYGNKVHVQVQSSSSSSSSTVKGEKFSRITWSSKNLSFRTGIKVFEMHKIRGSHVMECASLCERNGIYNCPLFAVDQSSQCYLLKFDLSSTWPDLGFNKAKVFIHKGEMNLYLKCYLNSFNRMCTIN